MRQEKIAGRRHASALHPQSRLRILARIGAAATLLTLAACTSMHPTGEGAGASASAAATLAGIRAAQGLPALVPDPQLEQAALQQAGYMAGSGRMSHRIGWGKDFASRVRENGITGAAGENIAEGRMDTARAIDTWMHSSPHRRNILDPRFTRYGLAYARDRTRPDWRYWSMVLGK